MYQYRKLRGRIVEVFGTASEFAKKLGISEVSVSKKLTCKAGFSQRDIETWASLLNINRDEYSEYFFK